MARPSIKMPSAIWGRLRTSFWFVPSAMVALAIAASMALIELDTAIGGDVRDSAGSLFTFGPEGARAILSVISGSMITVAGLTFSITMLSLQLATSQFGPRLLRNFMRDRGNQVVLGTFVGTFVYCLLILRSVRGTEATSFVPHLSVAFGVVLALASIAVLIYFFHHVATSIRVESLLARLAAEAREVVDRLYPEDRPTRVELRPDGNGLAVRADPRSVMAAESGYVHAVAEDTLFDLAVEKNLLFDVVIRPGNFVTEQRLVVTAYPAERVNEATMAMIIKAITTGPDRVPEADPGFAIQRVVEIAQRALSPSVNDPTTAMYCIDRLGEILERLAVREPIEAQHRDENGNERVLTRPVTPAELICTAFSAVYRYGKSDADVRAALLAALDHVAARALPVTRGPVEALIAVVRRESALLP